LILEPPFIVQDFAGRPTTEGKRKFLLQACNPTAQGGPAHDIYRFPFLQKPGVLHDEISVDINGSDILVTRRMVGLG
jgi:hypothetical protein